MVDATLREEFNPTMVQSLLAPSREFSTLSHLLNKLAEWGYDRCGSTSRALVRMLVLTVKAQ
jgi:hypothetical protein